MRRFGAALLNQQMWLFGCDVRRPAGNLLLECGFTRLRPANPGDGSSMYALHLPDTRCVNLWGFGMHYGADGGPGLYLRRYEFMPRLGQTPPPAWQPEHWPALAVPASPPEIDQTRALLAEALRWLGNYEQWVMAVCGLEYRQRCLSGWHKAVTSVEAMPAAWFDLAEVSQTLAMRSR